MPKTKIIHGKKQQKKYNAVPLDQLIGETVEAIGMSSTEGAWGTEPVLQFFFSNGKMHGICLPIDNS